MAGEEVYIKGTMLRIKQTIGENWVDGQMRSPPYKTIGFRMREIGINDYIHPNIISYKDAYDLALQISDLLVGNCDRNFTREPEVWIDQKLGFVEP